MSPWPKFQKEVKAISRLERDHPSLSAEIERRGIIWLPPDCHSHGIGPDEAAGTREQALGILSAALPRQ